MHDACVLSVQFTVIMAKSFLKFHKTVFSHEIFNCKILSSARCDSLVRVIHEGFLCKYQFLCLLVKVLIYISF